MKKLTFKQLLASPRKNNITLDIDVSIEQIIIQKEIVIKISVREPITLLFNYIIGSFYPILINQRFH